MISIIIPVFNSENTINIVVDKLEKELTGKISYNDGSADSSYRKCKQILESTKFIKFINLSRNFGQPSAMLAGLKFADGEYSVFIDDDLQTLPEEIWKLIDKINEGYDAVYANYFYKKQSIFRKFGSSINSILEGYSCLKISSLPIWLKKNILKKIRTQRSVFKKIQ